MSLLMLYVGERRVKGGGWRVEGVEKIKMYGRMSGKEG
jgi:hypothetical protein